MGMSLYFLIVKEVVYYGNEFIVSIRGDFMRNIAVNYTINDEEEERLKRITNEYMSRGMELSLENMFAGIMISGSNYDIDTKFRHHERELGIR